MPKGPSKKRSRAYYLSDRAADRLSKMAERSYTSPSRHLEKLIDENFETSGAKARPARPSRD
jgi:hypothetical protein